MCVPSFLSEGSPRNYWLLLKRGSQKELLSINVRTLGNKILQFDGLYSSTTIKDVKLLIQADHNVPAALQRLNLFDKPLNNQQMLDQCGITDGTVVNLIMHLRKPMIYLVGLEQIYGSNGSLHPNPKSQNIEVRLSLDRAWELCVLHKSMKLSPVHYVQSAT
jgi:hypothetical protein